MTVVLALRVASTLCHSGVTYAMYYIQTEKAENTYGQAQGISSCFPTFFETGVSVRKCVLRDV